MCCVQSLQSCLTLCSPMDCSPSGSSDQGIFQARIMEQGAVSSSRGSSRPWGRTWFLILAGRFFTTVPPGKPHLETYLLTSFACFFGLFVFSSLSYKSSLYILDKRSPTSGPQSRPSQVRKQVTQQEVSSGNGEASSAARRDSRYCLNHPPSCIRGNTVFRKTCPWCQKEVGDCCFIRYDWHIYFFILWVVFSLFW